MVYAGCAGPVYKLRRALREAPMVWMMLLVGVVVGMVSGVVGIGGGILFHPHHVPCDIFPVHGCEFGWSQEPGTVRSRESQPWPEQNDTQQLESR